MKTGSPFVATLSNAELVLRDYEAMMAEARAALANSPKPDIMEYAHVVAEHIAMNPGALIDWQGFLEVNRPK